MIMNITPLLTDESILAELGKRLAARRIDLELTQANLARQAGIGKRTLERIEAGHASQTDSLIRVLRALDALPGLENLVPETNPRPLDLLKRKGKVRKRASGKRGKRKKAAQSGDEPWQWGDD